MSQFTSYVPPPITYRPRFKSTTTRPARGHTPSSVAKWINFVDNARAHVWDDIIRLDNKPVFDLADSCFVNNETDVSRLFYYNILRNVQYCIERTSPADKFQFSSEYQIPRSGIPDYALLNRGNARFFIEVKTPWAISPTDIVEQYKQKTLPLSCAPLGRFSDT